MATDILFVNLPPYESYYAENFMHLGMLYVMTNLRNHGYTVGYLDCARHGVRREQIMEKIREAAPRLIGFSIDTDNLFSAGHLTHELKHEFGAELKIILGGPASQGQPDEIMERSAADVLVIGEGEYAACEVADCLLRGIGSLAAIEGICYRAGGKTVHTRPRTPIADLDALPFPDYRFLSDAREYQPAVITGRGCPFKCTFCFEGRMGNRYRHRSPENIVAEIERIIEARGPSFICINDDTFTADPKHTLSVCRLMRERFRPWQDLCWFCEVRVDVVNRYPELIDALVEAGAARIQIGAESADENVLRAYKRLNVKPATVEKVVELFYRAGLPSIYCGFILGGPHETTETMERTLAFAKHLLLDVAPGAFECSPSFLTPLPGTDIRARPESFGLRLLDPDLLTSSNFNFCTTESETLSQEEINNFRWQFEQEIDQGIRSIISRMPWERLEQHALLHERFRCATQYQQRFAVFPRLAEYLRVVGGGKFERTERLSDSEILCRYPTRLAAPVHMDVGKITVSFGPNVLTLNGMGSRIYALCAGKLATQEIIDHLAEQYLDDAPPREMLAADVVQFIRHLDDNFAVFLKDF